MIGVITGDIINSTKYKNSNVWLTPLKEALQNLSINSKSWEIYRGDSFQIEITDVLDCFINAVYIKSCMKTIKGIDVRMAIGIGTKTFEGNNVTESNGSAFHNSGYLIEHLKKNKTNLKIGTDNHKLDDELNLYFKLISIPMDNWSFNSAEIVKLHLENNTKIQKEIAELVGISQDAVSKRMKRANLDDILKVNKMYKQKITTYYDFIN